MRKPSAYLFCSIAAALFSPACSSLDRVPSGQCRIEVVLPASFASAQTTGRVYLVVGKDPANAARLQRSLGHQPVAKDRGVPFFGIDVHDARPGEVCATFDDQTLGYPVASLRGLPAGDYFVQAIYNVYTHFQRSDGHRLWAPMDHWDGQHFGWKPGNLMSKVTKVRLDPRQGYSIRLALSEVIGPVTVPVDTTWVKRVKIQSAKLSAFWGRPVHLGATLLLPRGYDSHPDAKYPAIYFQGHFSLQPPCGFTTQPMQESAAAVARRKARGIENGHDFYRAWNSDGFPRVVAVTFQHPTPFFDDSYAVNSKNNGPYQDALVDELIPYLEKHFRLVPQGFARGLTGGSTGGYESLALQIHRPEDFGGVWSYYPDSIDFRRLFGIDIYADTNAFRVPGYGGLRPERIAVRTGEGQPLQTIRQLSTLARVLGSRGRSCDYLEAWEAAFGPAGDDGYPRPLWDKATGAIDPEVAAHWRDAGYDLGVFLTRNWTKIGASLRGKIHIAVGDMDDYYFNLSVLKFQEVLEGLDDPEYGGSVTYGSPLKIHGWRPLNNAQR
ncbi:MAG: alpha/beta hydrolase-fold protein, partial [Planctomycetota bacterium]|nr:alpha/beta hydrolase-fold protein [Planctomycetota bacterium]